MKFKNIFLALALIVICFTAKAQPGFDVFGQTRKLVLSPVFSSGPAGLVTGASNNCVDIHVFTGTVTVDIFSVTNDNSTGNTVTFETSPDTTNWTKLANFALATPASVKYTNTYNATTVLNVTNALAVLIATNNYNLPGTNTTPTAATAGFGSFYLLPVPFTNAAAITMSNGVYTVAFRADDQPRYLHALYVLSGTNATVGAVLTGRLRDPYGSY